MQDQKQFNLEVFNSIVITIVAPVAVMILLLVLCASFSGLPSGAVQGGPSTAINTWILMIPMMIAIVAAAAALCWTVSPWYESAPTGQNNKQLVFSALCGGGVALLVMLLGTSSSLQDGHRVASFHRTMAPLVKEFASRNFDSLDLDHSSSIALAELVLASKRVGSWGNGNEGKIIAYMIEQQAELGHMVHSEIWDSNGFNSWVASSAVYEVNQADLARYSAYITDKYKYW